MLLHQSKCNQHAQLGSRQVLEDLTLTIISISLTIDLWLIHWTNLTSIYPESATEKIVNISEANGRDTANGPNQPRTIPEKTK